MYRILHFLLPFPFFAVCVVMIALSGIFGNVKPETMDRQTLIRVMQLRDFRRFSSDVVERLTDRAEQEFGRHSSNKPVFEFSPSEKKVHSHFQTHRSSQRSLFEYNLSLMTKTRYFQRMREYQSVSVREKAALMNDVVADMRYWQGVYFDYLWSLELPEPTLAELHEDFQRMLEGFKEGASPEDIVLIDSFAQDMNRAILATEVQKTILDSLPPLRLW